MSRWRREPGPPSEGRVPSGTASASVRRSVPLGLRIAPAHWELTRGDVALARGSFASLDELAGSLAGAHAAALPRTARVAVTLHEHWVRSFAFVPPAGVRSLSELRLLAARRMEQLFDAAAPAWLMQAPWHATKPFVVTAIPLPLLGAVEAFARQLPGRPTVDVLPAWLHALDAELAGTPVTAWAAIVQDGVLTVALAEQQRLVRARSLRTAADATAQQLAGLAEGEQLRQSIDAQRPTSALRWLDLRACGAAGSGRPARLGRAHDAARAGPRWWAWPRWRDAWPTALAGSSLLALTAYAAGPLRQLDAERNALAVRLETAAAAAAAVRPQAPRPAFAARAIEGFNAVTHRLNTPWPEVFAALEQATPADVALLSIEPDTAQARLRGRAAVTDHAAMLGYIEALAAQPLFTRARLVRHEIDEKATARPLAFQFEVRLLLTGQPAEGAR